MGRGSELVNDASSSAICGRRTSSRLLAKQKKQDEETDSQNELTSRYVIGGKAGLVSQHRPEAGASALASDCGILPSECYRIEASILPDLVPWGFVCGFPTTTQGDLYGGAHYMESAGNTTLQGRAIEAAAQRFGDGKTLPFTPCKKGYLPFCSFTGDRMYACPLHNEARKQRFESEQGKFRMGEVNLDLFWCCRRQTSSQLKSRKGTQQATTATAAEEPVKPVATVSCQNPQTSVCVPLGKRQDGIQSADASHKRVKLECLNDSEPTPESSLGTQLDTLDQKRYIGSEVVVPFFFGGPYTKTTSS